MPPRPDLTRTVHPRVHEEDSNCWTGTTGTLAVHPRVHGEDVSKWEQRKLADGSPPCARGRPSSEYPRHIHRRFTPVCTGKTENRPLGVARLRRFTPVCTGKTNPRVAPQSGRTVHPRVHGEDVERYSRSDPSRGSPPCARGRRLPFGPGCPRSRFTPVCTGKTQPNDTQEPWLPVHPRVHGEDLRGEDTEEREGGSPPCARGRLTIRQPPARLRPVHPRVHGEDVRAAEDGRDRPRFTPVCTGKTAMSADRLPQDSGSPPCARGRRFLLFRHAVVVRFTPVCTGKTTESNRRQGCRTVHPRVHGEDYLACLRVIGETRFTPVCTGKTERDSTGMDAGAVHPRVHGEDHGPLAGTGPRLGSPPCARGRRSRRSPRSGRFRFTPVCTGKT